MTHKVGPKGQIVIPKPIRETLALLPGDTVDFELANEGVLVVPVRSEGSLRGALAGHQLLAALQRERESETR